VTTTTKPHNTNNRKIKVKICIETTEISTIRDYLVMNRGKAGCSWNCLK